MGQRMAVLTSILLCVLLFPIPAAAIQPGLMPSIDIEKYVATGPAATPSPLVWYDADTAPGAYGLASEYLYIKYRLVNTGNMPFYHLELFDTDIYPLFCALPNELNPKEVYECVLGPLPMPTDQNRSMATAHGFYRGGVTTDTDAAYCFGAIVDLHVETLVRVGDDQGENGWREADLPPGPYGRIDGCELGNNNCQAYFKHLVVNIGNVPLQNVEVEGFGLNNNPTDHCVFLGILEPGESAECIVGPFPIHPGQQGGISHGHGHFRSWEGPDTDATYYFGAVLRLSMETYVGIPIPPEPGAGEGSFTWYEADDSPGVSVGVGGAIYYKFEGINESNVPLEQVEFIDPTDYRAESCLIAEPIAPGAAYECVIGPLVAQRGSQYKVVGTLAQFQQWELWSQDAAWYFGVETNRGDSSKARK